VCSVLGAADLRGAPAVLGVVLLGAEPGEHLTRSLAENAGGGRSSGISWPQGGPRATCCRVRCPMGLSQSLQHVPR
jgi:hypothetical protein